MDTNTMFERASRTKLRFDSPQGLLTIEDLWDLPLTAPPHRASLDTIAIGLHQLAREADQTISFVTPPADTGKAEILLAFEIVKYIIGVRVKERDERQEAQERKEKKQRLMELIARKQDQELEGKSVEELRAMVESL